MIEEKEMMISYFSIGSSNVVLRVIIITLGVGNAITLIYITKEIEIKIEMSVIYC